MTAPPYASGGPERPRVFLVDDHHLFRAGVRAEMGDAVQVVGEADEVDAAIELIAERVPMWCSSTCTCHRAVGKR